MAIDTSATTPNGPDLRVETGPKRVRTMFAGRWVADTTQPLLVWEHPWYPTYYLPAADVDPSLLVDTGEVDHSPGRGDAGIHDVVVGGTTAPGAALWYRDTTVEALRDTIRIDWGAMDAWFEEDEQVYVHPRDPYKRIDVLQSSRHVRISVDGLTVAETDQPRLLFETGLPVRYYLPKTAVRMDLLEAAEHSTRCPYKGTAEYYDLTVNDRRHDRFAWWYRHPSSESAGIAGYVCFYNEKVDLEVDGDLLTRPVTHFA